MWCFKNSSVRRTSHEHGYLYPWTFASVSYVTGVMDCSHDNETRLRLYIDGEL